MDAVDRNAVSRHGAFRRRQLRRREAENYSGACPAGKRIALAHTTSAARTIIALFTFMVHLQRGAIGKNSRHDLADGNVIVKATPGMRSRGVF